MGKNLNRHCKGDVQITNMYVKQCSASLFTKEVQIKITMRSLCTPTRMAISEKSEKTKYWQIVEKHGTIFIDDRKINSTATLENNLAGSL